MASKEANLIRAHKCRTMSPYIKLESFAEMLLNTSSNIAETLGKAIWQI